MQNSLLRTAVPRQHGAWAVLISCLIIGNAVSGTFNFKSFLILIGVTAGFFARHALGLAQRAKVSGLVTTLYALISLGTGLVVITYYKRWLLVLFGITVLIFTAITLALEKMRKDRTYMGEIIAITGLTLIIPITAYTNTGILSSKIIGLWIFSGAFFIGSVFYVRFIVRKREAFADNFMLRFKAGMMSLVYSIAVLVLAVYLAGRGLIPELAPLAIIPSTIKPLLALRRHSKRTSVRRIGYMELAHTCLFLALLIISHPTFAQGSANGQTIFKDKCVACHNIGGGKLVGPDLAGVTDTREAGWIKQFIMAPDKMFERKDPIAVQLLQEYGDIPMPNLGLTEDEAGAVISYIGGRSQVIRYRTDTLLPDSVPLVTGDSKIGQAVFTGEINLKNKGPACSSCHNIAGISSPGGGKLAKDLTDAAKKYGDTGLTSVLAAPPFPLMKNIYAGRPLTTDEQNNLKAFMQTVSVQSPAVPVSYGRKLMLWALAVSFILLVLFQLVWRKRTG